MSIAAWPTVVIVSVVVAALPLGVSVAGVNEQLARRGRPLHEKLTGVVKDPWGVTVRVKVAVWPSVMVWLAGLAAIVKLAAFTVWINPVDVLVRLMASPL